MKRLLLVMVLALAACGQPPRSGQELADLPTVTGEQLEVIIADLGMPAVVNVWASWCGPCRSEAPLLSEAEVEFGNEVAFIGIDVQDNQADAKDFIATYEVGEITHYFDRNRSVPQHYGGIGTPITFFFDASGEMVSTHLGVIDDRGLALGIDEITNR